METGVDMNCSKPQFSSYHIRIEGEEERRMGYKGNFFAIKP
jgi:hypothetical protein